MDASRRCSNSAPDSILNLQDARTFSSTVKSWDSARPKSPASFAKISAFAEIGEFMEQPVKTYSTGMLVRLAFAAAIHVEPDILVVDEALSSRGCDFSNRCVQKFQELKARGVTVLLVSHDLGLVKLLSEPRNPDVSRMRAGGG